MWDLNIFADDNQGEMKSLSYQSTRNVFESRYELRRKHFCIEERSPSFERGGDSKLFDGHSWERDAERHDDLWMRVSKSQSYKRLEDTGREWGNGVLYYTKERR